MRFWQAWRDWRDRRAARRHAISDELWDWVLQIYPFIAHRPPDTRERLRALSSQFLARKEFHGAQGLQVTDPMAVAIAAQACLPILNLGLAAYDGFVGIVVQPDEVLAQRETMDDDGIVHEYAEALTGEAMAGGPVMLAWADVAQAGATAESAYNVVIHEFAHVLDMRGDWTMGRTDAASRRDAAATLEREYQAFCDRVDRDEDTLLDPYGAEAPEEFFAVAAEAFFVQARALREEHPDLYRLLRECFRQDPAAEFEA